MMNQWKQGLMLLVTFAVFVSIVFMLEVAYADELEEKPLKDMNPGDKILFGDWAWIVLEPEEGYVLMDDFLERRQFDPYRSHRFNPGGGSNNSNIGYYLNTIFYGEFTNSEQSIIQEKDWEIATYYNDVTANIGLLSPGEWNMYKDIIGNPTRNMWLRTPLRFDFPFVDFVATNGRTGGVMHPDEYNAVRPALYLEASETFVIVENIETLLEVGFDPDGNDAWAQEHTTTVTVQEDTAEVSDLQYAWSESEELSDQLEWANFTDGDNLTTPDRLTGGYYLHIQGKDALSGDFHARSEVFHVDNTNPTAPEIYAPTEPVIEETKVEITAGTDEDSGVDRTEYRIAEGEWQTYEEVITITEKGETKIEARTVDKAGNTSNISEATVQINRSAGESPVKQLKDLEQGDEITFADAEWIMLEPEEGYIFAKNAIGHRSFDTGMSNRFNPMSTNNIGYYLNTTYYNTLADAEKEVILPRDWGIGRPQQENNVIVKANIGLLSTGEWWTYGSSDEAFLESPTAPMWLRTPDAWGHVWALLPGGTVADLVSFGRDVRPALTLNPNIYISDENEVILTEEVVFEPDGNDTWTKEHQTTVTVKNDFGEVQYVWSAETTKPSEGWEMLESDSIQTPDDVTGGYYLHIQGEYEAGGKFHVHSKVFNVDNTPPPTPEVNTLPSWLNTRPLVDVVYDQDEHSGHDKALYRMKSKDNDTDDWTAWQEVPTFLYVSTEGEMVVEVKTVDKAGNESEIASGVTRYDSTAPAIDFSTNGNPQASQVASTAVTVTDVHSGVFRLQYLWSTENSIPEEDAEWESFNNEEEISKEAEDGEWYLHIQATDRAGNKAYEVSHAFVLDNTPPGAPQIETDTTDWTNAEKVAVTITGEDDLEYQLNGTDGEWLTYTDSFDVVDEGITTIYARAVDQAGNTSQFVENTVQIDRTAPKLTLLGDNPVNLLYGESYEEPGYEVTDNFMEDLTVEITGEVNTKKVGTYELTYRVQDQAGNETTAVRTVNIHDEEQPVITLKGDNPLTLEVGTTYEEPGATAVDNVDGDISGEIIVTGEVDTTNLEIYQLHYNVSDSSGNQANEVIRTVEVVDTTPPELTLNGDSEMQLELGGPYNEPGATATDNYDDDLTNEITITGKVNTEKTGTYKIVYTVKDSSDNISSTKRIVRVVDSIAPTNVELSAKEITTGNVTLAFSSYDLGGIKEYILFRDGKKIARIDRDETTFTDKDLESGTTYQYSMIAVDASGNQSKAVTLEVVTKKEEKIQLEEISNLPDITVAYGTARKDIPLPTEISITLSNGEEVEVPVKWNKGVPVYDEQKAGAYTFTGDIILPEGVTNPDNKKATVKVVVKEQPPVDKEDPEDDNKDITVPKHRADNKDKSAPKSLNNNKGIAKDKPADSSNQSGNDNRLPNTATNMYNWLVIGSLFIISAIVIWQVNRRRNRME